MSLALLTDRIEELIRFEVISRLISKKISGLEKYVNINSFLKGLS